jgi:catechol 2,3-dioxygenase-like lactoylglutathione lyase family enzyme
MPISEQIKWGLGPPAPAGPGQSPGLYLPNRTFNFLLLELRFPYLRAYGALPLGIFIKSKDPKALTAWYRDVLGLKIEVWGGAALSYDAPHHPPVVVWSPFPETTSYMAPSTRDFMLNFAVDDLDAFLAKLAAKNVTILKRNDSDPSGKFAWILDPDGTKIELWQAKKP